MLVFVLGIVLRLPAFGRPLLSDDEAIYATTADAMMRGDLLYRDVVDHKPPLIYHVYQAGFALFGPYDVHGAHALVLLSVLLTAGLLFLALRAREGPKSKAGSDARTDAGWDARVALAAAGLFLVFSTTWHDYDALAANCELFLLAPQTAAAWLLLRDLRRPSPLGKSVLVHLVIGALVGTSALCKYQGLTFWGASIGLLAWWSVLGRAPWSRTAVLAGCHVVGALVPPAMYLMWCWVAGNAAATLYWFRFNFSYVGAGLSGVAALARGVQRTFMIGGVALVPYSLGLAAAVATAARAGRLVRGRLGAGRPRDVAAGATMAHPTSAPAGVPTASGASSRPPAEPPAPEQVLGLLWLATSALAVTAGGRFFGHYFHLVLPALCLLAAPGFTRLWQRSRRHRGALALGCAAPAAVFFALATFGRSVAAKLDEGEPAYDEVAARIAALTSPEQRMFVWGNSPQLYILARRPMGARFSFCNYMTGESPGTPTETGRWNADANQLPVAWDMLFADLEQRRPALLVDASAAGWDGYERYPMARYPRLAAYVDAHYRPVEVRAGVALYRRWERTK